MRPLTPLGDVPEIFFRSSGSIIGLLLRKPLPAVLLPPASSSSTAGGQALLSSRCASSPLCLLSTCSTQGTCAALNTALLGYLTLFDRCRAV